MKFNHNYKRVIAIAEKSAGNETIGDMYLITKSFDKTTPISKIIDWAEGNATGKLIITIDEQGTESE